MKDEEKTPLGEIPNYKRFGALRAYYLCLQDMVPGENGAYLRLNSKHEIRNSKQIQNTKI